ncbi:tyrosine-type recombinase/integrase [Vibrio parahaemolyticus]|nr:tyrosine-type recombinase/integrase [Vibrio parahaemolyticus]MDF5141650.1 tyrosine-type recombinase/integrase [Vibrio parahaemolyticus]MDF5152130.1 tyrosine-type recombinase/integrase [Vibrio parahaemolyticus]
MTLQTGESRREKSRLEHIEKVKQKADNLFDEAFPSPESIASEEEFIKGWERFEQSLLNVFGPQKDFRQGFKHGEHRVNANKKKHGWPYSPPSTIITNRPPTQTRDKKWLAYSWAIYDQYATWRDTHLNVDLQDASLRYQSLMLSLIFESGQMSIDVVNAFHHAIISQQPLSLQRVSCYTYLTLLLDNENLNTNAEIDGERVTQYHCYLSLHTLAQLNLWQKTDLSEWSAPETPQQIDTILTCYFSQTDNLRLNLTTICRAAASWYERHHNVSISQALIEFRMGRTRSYSLPLSNLKQVLSPHLNMPRSASFYDFNDPISLPKGRETSTKITNAPRIKDSEFYELVSIPFKTTQGQKISAQKLAEDLSVLVDSYSMSDWQACFVNWLRFKLETCTSSTVNSYRTTLIKDWVFMNTEFTIDNTLNEGALEEIYEEQINRHKSPKSRKNFAARLKDFHRYTFSFLNLPRLSDDFFHCDSTQKHTRAGFIDEHVFGVLIKHIQTLDDINVLDRLALQCICIMSYRCGLRIAELYKLQMGNISHCDQIWVEVRPNQFANNKTASSLRRVPVLPLLLEQEKEIFNQYLRQKRTLSKSQSSPLFTLGEDPNAPFNLKAVSNYVGSFLKIASGQEHWVFHHLRHSCLSRLQLMLELENAYEILPYAYPYDQKQSADIQQLLFKGTSLKGYWEIAAFAGHEDPEMTFSHYFHFSDLLASPHKADYLRSLSLHEATQCGLLSHDRYWKMRKRNNEQVLLAHAAAPLYKKLNVQLVSASPDQNEQRYPSLLDHKAESFSIELCYQVLDAIASGQSVDRLALEYRISSSIVEQWVDNAEYLKSLSANPTGNNVGQSRLFSTIRQHSLVPGRLKTNKEKEYVRKFNAKLRNHYKHHQQQFTEQMQYFLTHCTASQSGVTFNQPELLSSFIDAFSFAIPKAHWRVVTLYMRSSRLQKEWKAAYAGIKTIVGEAGTTTGRTGHGSVRLELISPDEETMTANNELSKYSSHLLVYILFFTFVMVRKA